MTEFWNLFMDMDLICTGIHLIDGFLVVIYLFIYLSFFTPNFSLKYAVQSALPNYIRFIHTNCNNEINIFVLWQLMFRGITSHTEELVPASWIKTQLTVCPWTVNPRS